VWVRLGRVSGFVSGGKHSGGLVIGVHECVDFKLGHDMLQNALNVEIQTGVAGRVSVLLLCG
jgi:hypothetical protein